MIDINELDKLYLSYGFEKYSKRYRNTALYLLRQGHFLNVDIIPLCDENDSSKAFEELSKAGFACQTRNYKSISDAEGVLFQGFFASDSTKRRLEQDYNRFCENQSSMLGGEYSYIPCRYIVLDSDNNNEGNLSIVEMVKTILLKKGAQLVVIEAAAGFGKTCTAYEILKSMINASMTSSPIFTELSRNRTARIFRYVLLDEIDRNYFSLKSDLVVREIATGRLPLIIDGFDELLRREKTDSEFEEAESMLATISELLTGEAKVLLTSRKTAIFAGDDFNSWIEQKTNTFTVTRIAITEPHVEDWLGKDRVQKFKENRIPFQDIANPVLLTFIKNLNDEDFKQCCINTEIIAENYFLRMLQRERVRQNLILDEESQKKIFISLAAYMAEKDFNAESREFIKEIILEENQKLLQSARLLYPATERPTAEEIADKLAGHALLDRIGRSDDSVGFVNDFVFGSLLAEYVCESQHDEWVVSERFIDMLVTAARIRSFDKRKKLWEKLNFVLQLLSTQRMLIADLDLIRSPNRMYKDANFEGVVFRDCVLGSENGTFTSCVFVKCVFNNVSFSTSYLKDVGFVECRFFSCNVINVECELNEGRWSVGCDVYPENDDSFLSELAGKESLKDESAPERNFEKEVLEQFWPCGRTNATRMRKIRTLFSGFSSKDRDGVSGAIESLRKKGIIILKGDAAEIVLSKINDIKSYLGR